MLLNPAQEPRVWTPVSGREWKAAFLKLKLTWIDLVLIHLDLSAEAHAHISGCPVNLFSRCFTVTTNKR